MNWRLSESAVDYFAAGDADRPLDHFWSLAVEEQFYVAWPLLLLAVGCMARRRAPGRHGPLAALLGLVVAVSFAYAVQRTGAAPEQAYFSAATRAWELAAGGLLALALLGRRLGARPARAAAWAGAGGSCRHARARRRERDAGRARAAARVRRDGAARRRDERRAFAADARAGHPARALRRAHLLRVVCLALARAGVRRGRTRPALRDRGMAVTFASLVPALSRTAGSRSPCDARRCTCDGRARSWSRRSPARPPPCCRASRCRRGSHRRPRCPRAGPRAPASSPAPARIQASATALRPRPVDAEADRGKPYRDGCLVEERGDALAALRLRRPAAARDRRAVRRLARDAAVPRARARRAAPPLAAREPDQGGLPALGRLRRVAALAPRYPECDAWRESALRRIEREERPALVLAAGSAAHRVLAGSERLEGDANQRALRTAGGRSSAGCAPRQTRSLS